MFYMHCITIFNDFINRALLNIDSVLQLSELDIQ